jgi:hypothetical protein
MQAAFNEAAPGADYAPALCAAAEQGKEEGQEAREVQREPDRRHHRCCQLPGGGRPRGPWLLAVEEEEG